MLSSQDIPTIRPRPRREKAIAPLTMTMAEAADRLGMGRTKFYGLTKSHPLYAPDGNNGVDPRWSEELLRLIEFARRTTPQGVRELSDDEALKARRGLNGKRRREYLDLAEDYA